MDAKNKKGLIAVGIAVGLVGIGFLIYKLVGKPKDKNGNGGGAGTGGEEGTSGGANPTAETNAVYPKPLYSASNKSEGVTVRNTAEVNDGYINNRVAKILYPNKIGTKIKEVKGADQMTWYQVTLATPVNIGQIIQSTGFVRSDVVDVK